MLFTATIAATMAPAQRSWGEPPALLRVESNAGGEIELDARRAPVAQVLRAIADAGGFEVLMEESSARPLVNATVDAAPVEDVLREILRDRNYALVYRSDATSLSQVIVLPPSGPRPRYTAPRAPRSAARARQPIVVSR